jgi:nitrite reductase (NO-forming)
VSHQDGLDENPRYIVFNGGNAMVDDSALCATVGEPCGSISATPVRTRHRRFTWSARSWIASTGEGDLISPPARGLQTTLVPPGGASVVEFVRQVPGMYTFLDPAIFRIQKGAMGMIHVEGPANPAIYDGRVTPLGVHMSHH